MKNHIRQGTLQDIDTLLKITKSCATHMIAKGIHQWNENYPNKDAFVEDVQRKELYVIENNLEIVGCIVVSELMDDEYQSVTWLTPNDSNLYIHRLAVHPKFQGKGFAQQLMKFAENYAIKNNYRSIRLDTFSKNKRNQNFYELRGYKKLEDIFFPKQSVYPFHCYERIF